MTTPIRLQLSRRKGYSLQSASIAANGLPAHRVTRPGLFGNPFAVTAGRDTASAVRAFRGFLRTWSESAIADGTRFEDGTEAPVAGIGMIVLRNRIRANIWRLRGHNLACFCAPGTPCHADIYLALMATDWPERWKARYPKLCEEVRP